MISCSFASWACYGQIGVFNVESGGSVPDAGPSVKSGDLKAYMEGLWKNDNKEGAGKVSEGKAASEKKRENEAPPAVLEERTIDPGRQVVLFGTTPVKDQLKAGPVLRGGEKISFDPKDGDATVNGSHGETKVPGLRKVRYTDKGGRTNEYYAMAEDLPGSVAKATFPSVEASEKNKAWMPGLVYRHLRIPGNYGVRFHQLDGKTRDIIVPPNGFRGDGNWPDVFVAIPQDIDTFEEALRVSRRQGREPLVQAFFGEGKGAENVKITERGYLSLVDIDHAILRSSPASNAPGNQIGINGETNRRDDGTQAP